MDSKIRVYDTIGNPIAVLEGHTKGVISFSWTSDGLLVSGSWDGTAKIWHIDVDIGKGICVKTLGPHENG